MDSAQLVRRFEHEFKNNANHGITDELMSEDFVRHLPYRGLPPGRAGMRAAGELVTGAIHDITSRSRSSSPKVIWSPTRSRQPASAPAPGRH